MNSFLSLPYTLRGLLMLWNVLLVLAMIYSVARSIQSKKKVLFIVMQALILAGALILFGFMYCLNLKGYGVLARFKLSAIYALLFLLSLICLAQMVYSISADRRVINSGAIREAIERLPTGICCYYPGGLCKLVNDKLDWICHELTGSGLRDGEAFWKMLTTGSIFRGTPVRTGNYPIVLMPGGNVMHFRRDEITVDGVTLLEIIASDVTEEYELTLKLQQRETALKEINQRLKNLGERISELTIEKEILNSKIVLHDSWSRTLLATQQYLKDKSSKDPYTMYRLWDKQLGMLEKEASSSNSDPYAEFFHSAKALGIRVNVTGTLPKETGIAHIVCQALTTALGNLVRHARGTQMYVTSGKSGENYILTFTNNGGKPEGPIRETGGLSTLRRLVEASGGTMEVSHTPHFKLQIEIGEKEYGI